LIKLGFAVTAQKDFEESLNGKSGKDDVFPEVVGGWCALSA
jgi:hypothetical protein